DYKVTGVQTCALPISILVRSDELRVFVAGQNRVRTLTVVLQAELLAEGADGLRHRFVVSHLHDIKQVDAPVGHHAAGVVPEPTEIGRASCRERGEDRG